MEWAPMVIRGWAASSRRSSQDRKGRADTGVGEAAVTWPASSSRPAGSQRTARLLRCWKARARSASVLRGQTRAGPSRPRVNCSARERTSENTSHHGTARPSIRPGVTKTVQARRGVRVRVAPGSGCLDSRHRRSGRGSAPSGDSRGGARRIPRATCNRSGRQARRPAPRRLRPPRQGPGSPTAGLHHPWRCDDTGGCSPVRGRDERSAH